MGKSQDILNFAYLENFNINYNNLAERQGKMDIVKAKLMECQFFHHSHFIPIYDIGGNFKIASVELIY